MYSTVIILNVVRILGAFAKATVSFVISSSVRLYVSVCPYEKTRFPLEKVPWNSIFEYFLKSVEIVQVLLKSDKNNGQFTWISVYIYGSMSLNCSWNEKTSVENIKPHILCSATFFFSPENHAVYEIMSKNMAEPGRPYAICMLDNQSYTHTHTE